MEYWIKFHKDNVRLFQKHLGLKDVKLFSVKQYVLKSLKDFLINTTFLKPSNDNNV